MTVDKVLLFLGRLEIQRRCRWRLKSEDASLHCSIVGDTLIWIKDLLACFWYTCTPVNVKNSQFNPYGQNHNYVGRVSRKKVFDVVKQSSMTFSSIPWLHPRTQLASPARSRPGYDLHRVKWKGNLSTCINLKPRTRLSSVNRTLQTASTIHFSYSWPRYHEMV